MWLKLSDDLWGHPKFVRARGAVGGGDRGVCVMGLWLEAALYCAKYGTDGKITALELRSLGTHDETLVAALVTAELWEVSTDGGYQFHDWTDYQVAAEKVRKLREEARVRMKAKRAPGAAKRRLEPAAQAAAGTSDGSALPAPLEPNELGKPDNAAQRDVVEAHRGAALLVLDAINMGRKQVAPQSRGTKKSYRTLIHIAQRLQEGATVEDALHVVKVCIEECRDDPKSIKWFDHITPFRPDNFERKRVCPLGVRAGRPAPTTGLGPAGLSPYAAVFDGGSEDER